MAKFELGILNNNNVKTPFTVFDTNIENNIPEWFQIKKKYTYFDKENTSTYNYSSDEQLTIHKNSKAELSFKMQKFIVIDDNFTFNPFINRIHNGTIIYLSNAEKGNKERIKYFWVNNISYNFSKINITYDIKCQDIFSYINSRRNNGYQIKNDINDINFIGAHTIDWWTKKIVEECKIQYSYVGIEDIHIDGIEKVYYDEKGNFTFNYNEKEITKNSKNYLRRTNIPNKYKGVIKGEEKTFLEEDLLNYLQKIGYINLEQKEKCWINEEQKAAYNISIAFSVSNSNAYNALVSLGQEVGLILQIDDNTRTFWFKPEKNEQFNGWYYSPNTDLKTFSLSQAGDTLVTVLNVEPRVLPNGDYVTLIPDKISDIINLLKQTTNKKKSTIDQINYYNYFDSYYSNLIKLSHQKTIYDNLNSDELKLLSELNKIPWLDNKIINLEYFENFNLISKEQFKKLFNLLYNDLRRANIDLLFCSKEYSKETDNYIKAIIDSENNINKFMLDFNTNAIKKKAPKGESAETKATTNKAVIYTTALVKFYNEVLWPKDITQSKIINYNEQISKYAKDLYNYQQEFLEAAYLFNKEKEKLSEEGKIIKDEKTNENKIEDNPDNFIGIENLIGFWKRMYDASWHCEYFIPETGLKLESDGLVYKFINQIFVPSVERVPDQNKKQSFKFSQLKQGGQRTELFLNHYLPKGQYWEVEENNQIKVDEYKVLSGGKTWMSLIEEWNLQEFPKGDYYLKNVFGGIESMQLCYWLRYYCEDNSTAVKDYNEAVEIQRGVWSNIYDQFGEYLLEQNYQDKYALNSDELYQNAMLYFKDISSPENQYNLSIINVAALKGYKGDEIQVSDQIRLAADEFYGENDDLKEIIRQPLFITDINYNLRSDEEIKLTVNAVKYQDKVIQRLVSLIK